MQNRLPFVLCIIGGLLLIVAGYSQGVSTIVLLYQLAHSIAPLSPVYPIIDLVLFFLWIIAWLGGFAVIAGGYLLTTTHVTLGKLIIAVATGFGIISFILTLFYVGITSGLAGLLVLTLSIINTAWALGLVLTVVARAKAV
ncbi:hypothetical protein EU538_11765 [Candidatus Thorarchaeota archaeon]|nr:MAG: hypothetical protein EU538_11765 [Candidatus Thorarchaeota archaeon]